MGDPAYIKAEFDLDIIKARANKTGWWNSVADMCKLVFPYLRLLQAADLNALMLSKVHGHKEQLEAHFQSWLSGTATTTGSSMVINKDMMEELIWPIFKAKHMANQSGLSYWANITTEFVLTAGVLDPEFHDDKLWLWPGTIDTVEAHFHKRYEGTDIENAMHTHVMLYELDLYKDKRGKFTAVHLWLCHDANRNHMNIIPEWQF